LKDKPTSIRLGKLIEDIDNICDGIGCSRNEWIKDTLRDGVRRENSQDQDQKPEEIEPKVTITEITEPEPKIEEIPEVKEVRIVEEPIDNSKKPIVNFVPYNGQLLPFAKRYEI